MGGWLVTYSLLGGGRGGSLVAHSSSWRVRVVSSWAPRMEERLRLKVFWKSWFIMGCLFFCFCGGGSMFGVSVECVPRLEEQGRGLELDVAFSGADAEHILICCIWCNWRTNG